FQTFAAIVRLTLAGWMRANARIGRSYAVALAAFAVGCHAERPGSRAFSSRAPRRAGSPRAHDRQARPAPPRHGREALANLCRADRLAQHERRHRLHRTHADAPHLACRTPA